MKLIIEIEIENHDQIEEGSDWPPYLNRFKDSGHIPQQVKSVKVFNHPVEPEISGKSDGYEWLIFSSLALKLHVVSEEG